MSQAALGIINPATTSGTALATALTDADAARLTQHKGASRPAYAVAGTVWLSDAASPWTLYLYDGTDDIPLGTIDPATNAFTPYLGPKALGSWATKAATHTRKSTAHTVVAGDNGRWIEIDTTSGALVVDLLALATAGVGFSFVAKNTGTGGNALTITPNGAETIGGAASLALADGETALVWAGTTEHSASVIPITGAIPNQATQAAIEAETDENAYLPPDLVKHSPGVAKFWCKFDGSASGPFTPAADYNVVDVTDNGTGDYTVNIETDFSGADWAVFGIGGHDTAGVTSMEVTAQAAGTVRVNCWRGNGAGHAVANFERVYVGGYGDQ